jgi:polyisoprenyl-phosphate glycosyltransferase
VEVSEERPDISIVVPVYGCAGCIEMLLERTRAVVEREAWRAEWVFVDDASPDDSWRILKTQSSKDNRIRGVRLGRNCGQHFAIYAGLKEAKGRFCLVMDCDLEDPPEEIPQLMRRARQGFDVVIATYFDRSHPGWRRLGSRLYFWMLRGGNLKGAKLSTFSVLSDRARSAFIAAPLARRAYLLVLLGFDLPIAFISSRKEPRADGASSYDPRTLAFLAARNMLLFSPRRLVVVLGTVALGMLALSAALWGAWPVMAIWLFCCILIGAALGALRWHILTPARCSILVGETEKLPEIPLHREGADR